MRSARLHNALCHPTRSSPLIAQLRTGISLLHMTGGASTTDTLFSNIPAIVEAMTVSADGKLLALAYKPSTLEVRDIEHRTVVRTVPAFRDCVQDLVFSPDG